MEVQQTNNQRERGNEVYRFASVRKCNVMNEVWIGWYCLWSLLHGDPGCKCEASDNERYTCKGRSMCKGEYSDLRGQLLVERDVSGCLPRTYCPSYGWWLDVVHRNCRVVHLQCRHHGNRLHQVFALSTTESEIKSHKSGFFVLTFVDVGEGKTDSGLGRGDEGEVGTFELLDRLRLMMSVPPSRMLLRAFSLYGIPD